MQGWIVGGAWLFAVLFAAVVLGFAGYEVSWKTRRVKADGKRLSNVVTELNATAAQLHAAADRAQRMADLPPVSRSAEPTSG